MTSMTKTVAVAATAVLFSAGLANALTLTGTVRDFNNSHPNFGQGSPFTGALTGIVDATLTGSAPTPVFVQGDREVPPVNFTTHNDFNQWWQGTGTPFAMNFSEAGGEFSYDGADAIPGAQFFAAGNGNFLYTLQFSGLLSFEEGDFFDAASDDDLWIFVNKQLVLEMGGVHAPTSASFSAGDLMAFNMVAGEKYSLDVFYAERNVSQAELILRTNMSISAVPVPAALPLLLTGLAAFGFVSRRRRAA